MTEKKTIWNLSFVVLLIFDLFIQFATSIVDPIVANYAVAMGASIALAGFLAGLRAAVSVLTRPFSGPVLQNISKKKLLLAASIGFALSSFLCAVVPNVAVLGFARVLFGLSFVLKSTLIIVFVAAAVPKECIGQGVGIIGLTNVIANAVGPGIGSWVGQTFGYPLTFLISSILFVLAFLILTRLDDSLTVKVDKHEEDERFETTSTETSGSAHPAKETGLRRVFSELIYFKTIPIALLSICEAVAFSTVNSMILLVGEQREISGVSMFFLVYAIVAFALRPFVSKLYDRFGFGKIAVPFTFSLFSAMLAFAYMEDNLFSIGLAAVLFAVGQSALYPCLQAESVRGVSPENTALAANTFLIGIDLGCTIGPFMSGFIMQNLGITAMFYANAALVALMLFLFIPYLRWRKNAVM